MRKLPIILDEVHKQCTEDNCQSWNNICLESMNKALDEYREDIIEKADILMVNPASTKEDFIKLFSEIKKEL